MLLAVDIGNTKIKAAVFEGDAFLARYDFAKDEAKKKIEKIFSEYQNISAITLSSVGMAEEAVVNVLSNYCPVTIISRESNFPFFNDYASPDTLGIDRMVLAAGAVFAHPGTNRLVIDAGTCVTYDFITSENSYLGGAISPGLQLRYNAMHNFTAKLPLLYPEMPESHVGDTTKSSMHSGVVNGLLFEIEGFISRYEAEYGDVTVILTGGDALFLAEKLKSTIFANSNFLLESLNKLYSIQNKHD